MKSEQMPAIKRFIDIIDEMIKAALNKRDTTELCIITAKNSDGTYAVTLLSDSKTRLSSVINQCRYDFTTGDYAYLYKVNNKLANSFIFAKVNP